MVRDTFLGRDQEAIVAQCTPTGPGALALLRISGDDAVAVATRISRLASGQSLLTVPTHTIHYGWVIDNKGNTVDNVLFLLMHGPRTFTGQDTVEITCHNNPFIIEKIMEIALDAGARSAGRGEFSYRSVLNGKMDLIQAESINELIHANTQKGLAQALEQINGSFSHWIKEVEGKLVKALAFCEASFEFIDEEMAFDDQIRTLLVYVLDAIARIKGAFDKQNYIRQGVRIALVGSVNVGKSSLFNSFLQQKRAIVTPVAGTTRDVIEAGIYRSGVYWTIIDTAGLRETHDNIEREGIERSFEQAALADILLLVFDSSRPLTEAEKVVYTELYNAYANKTICVRNKIDLFQGYNQATDASDIAALCLNGVSTHTIIEVSAMTCDGMAFLYTAIEQRIHALLGSLDMPFLLNKRQSNVLLSLEKELLKIQEKLEGTIPYELISYHLTEALSYLTELTGKSMSEQGMDALFKEFCVGK